MASSLPDSSRLRHTGRCLCGKVSFSVTLAEPVMLQACHCRQCQRWTGSGYPFVNIPITNIEGYDPNQIQTYNASEFGERANCKTCSSPIWWRHVNHPIDVVAAGLLDDPPSDLSIQVELYCDRRAPWLQPIPGAKQILEADSS